MSRPTRAQRRLFAVLDQLPAATAAQLAADHVQTLTAAAPRHWQCPICFTVRIQTAAPAGWWIVEPFTRVAACQRRSCRRIGGRRNG